ncbi:MAG: hypothetical protein MUE53_07535 [Chitinophagales bacterium]|jgi:protein-tyrosine-phosphatase|nr:hypothetical protein [Chitinophagales bacterium]
MKKILILSLFAFSFFGIHAQETIKLGKFDSLDLSVKMDKDSNLIMNFNQQAYKVDVKQMKSMMNQVYKKLEDPVFRAKLEDLMQSLKSDLINTASPIIEKTSK